jgi:hypothetical protein
VAYTRPALGPATIPTIPFGTATLAGLFGPRNPGSMRSYRSMPASVPT